MSAERWRPVAGYEGLYEVSDFGRVRSLDRKVTQRGKRGCVMTRLLAGRVLSPATNRDRGGYRYVNLHVDGQQCLRRVAVLVAAAFLGPRPFGMETCHRNGVADDDRAENLRYDTPKNNAADRKAHGTHLCGEALPQARLTETDVREILTSSTASEVLAARFSVHPGHINNIRRGVRWSHVRV
jgi:hypothetical protein